VLGDRERPARIRAEQQRALVHEVRREAYAYAPFWRDRLDQAGVSPASVRSLDDLARLPLTELDDVDDPASLVLRPDGAGIRRFGSRGLAMRLGLARLVGRVAVLNERVLEPVYKPVHWIVQAGLPVGYSAEDLERLAELGRRWLEAAGLRRGDVLVGLVPPGPNLAFWELAEGTRRAGVSALLLSPMPPVEDVAGLHPTVLAGRPSDLANLLDAAAEAGVRLPSVHTILAAGEPLEEGVRDRLEFRAEGAAVMSAWAPAGVRSLWAECRGGRGLHTSPAVELLEVVDPHTGAAAPPGSEGEVVWTSIGWRGTVFLRLRTDVYATLEDGPCPACGRTTPRVVPATSLPASTASLTTALERDERVALWQVELRQVGDEEEVLVFLAPAAGADLLGLLGDLDHEVPVTQFVVLERDELDDRLIEKGDARVVDLR
jgi:phenylacetate-CoA ligase